jgi:2-polyprenyl-3-methyl-5-hydroxy-6-metoxy-1,4-benzoquinol methylase
MENSFTLRDWSAYYSRKRIVHQWMQAHLLVMVGCRRVLEIGPAYGLVTSILVNAGCDVVTLDLEPRAFAYPDTRHIQRDLIGLQAEEIEGYDAIICCETLEHIEFNQVGRVLSTLKNSGAKYLIVSVPYMGFQISFNLYLNRHVFRQAFSLKKLRATKSFKPEPPPGGHQWEVGYKGYSLRRWETKLHDAGWSILKREFTGPCRSVFHVLTS